MPVDDNSKQFRRELLNYRYLEGKIKMWMMQIFLLIFKWLPNLYDSESLAVGHDIFKEVTLKVSEIFKWVLNLHTLESLPVGNDIFKNHSFVPPRIKSCS